MKMKYLPNYITGFRILATILMVFQEVFSKEFFVLYTLAGFSDILDGWIARKWKITSEFGAKLDSVADLIYYAVMGVMIFPVLLQRLPIWIWCMLAVIFLLRILSYGFVAVKFRQLASLHTYLNKFTGLIVFLLPYVIRTPIAVGFCTVGCVVAFLAAVEELMIHVRKKEYKLL